MTLQEMSRISTLFAYGVTQVIGPAVFAYPLWQAVIVIYMVMLRSLRLAWFIGYVSAS